AIEPCRISHTKGNSMRHVTAYAFILAALVCGVFPALAQAQGAGIEWETLNQEVMELYRAGHYDRAVVVARKALQVAEQNVGREHPDVATSLNNLAALYRAQGAYTQAEPLIKRALAIQEKALGREHPDVATSLENLADLYRATKRETQAQELERRAARIRAIKR
ncbi:MAG: tetratricopeptide repeat protein, partial [Thiobacillaceae bacterium]|nr:tetratricopeptide repeat protein [Thiobacillaceae bacterium]